MQIPVIIVVDIGKTNKKIFAINQQYQIVYDSNTTLPETVDEDGFTCENIELLTAWIVAAIDGIFQKKEFKIVAINFSTYGASFVYINSVGKTLTPLYNYLKPYSPLLQQQFYASYNANQQFAITTASPVLGNLNSGMQLYALKHQQPQVFEAMHAALHLPQYCSYLFTKQAWADITSIGCHTNLWNFTTHNYHHWVLQEGLATKLPAIFASNKTITTQYQQHTVEVGIGLHDSSAALVPYLASIKQPFVLISTGTWCIAFNPFNNQPLTNTELQQDCLCYLTYIQQPVKAARLFAGYLHEQATESIATHFGVDKNFYKTIVYNANVANTYHYNSNDNFLNFTNTPWQQFSNATHAYYALMQHIMYYQIKSLALIITNNIHQIFVDGGFSKNSLYMHLLAKAFPSKTIYASTVAQATAIGAAMAIHDSWNKGNTIPNNIVSLEAYTL